MTRIRTKVVNQSSNYVLINHKHKINHKHRIPVPIPVLTGASDILACTICLGLHIRKSGNYGLNNRVYFPLLVPLLDF